MSNDREIAADQSSPPIDQTQIDKILTSVWETAARLNPMLLATLRPDYEFERLLEMIRDCLARGLSAADATAHTLREFLRSAGTNNQPHNKCDSPGLPPPNQRQGQSP